MFFFGFQDRIRKIMLKGEKKICSFLCFWANELRIKTPEGNYAAIFIPQGLEPGKSTDISGQTGHIGYN